MPLQFHLYQRLYDIFTDSTNGSKVFLVTVIVQTFPLSFATLSSISCETFFFVGFSVFHKTKFFIKIEFLIIRFNKIVLSLFLVGTSVVGAHAFSLIVIVSPNMNSNSSQDLNVLKIGTVIKSVKILVHSSFV